MQTEYYYITDGKSQGPYNKEALKVLGVDGETLVWRAGLPDWVKASDLDELKYLFADNSAFGTYAEMPSDPYFAMIGGERVGPFSIEGLIERGLKRDTPVWKNGMSDWMPASSRSDIMEVLDRRCGVPPYNPYGGAAYGMPPRVPADPYGAGRNVKHSEWLTWAIVGTVIGFLFSCIGVIFGIIGIVQANKANNFYAQGNNVGGDMADSSAKTMTVISLVLGGLGFVTLSLFGVTGALSSCSTVI